MKLVDICPVPAASCRTVVLLHSSGSTSRQWRGLAEALQRRYRVRAVEFHPAGGRGVPHGAGWPTLVAAAHFVARVMHDEGPVHLIGHSYGGAVALRAAALDPAGVASVAVYEPVLFRWLIDGDPDSEAARGVVMVADAIRKYLSRGDAYKAAERFLTYWSGAGTWVSLSADRRDVVAGRMHAVLGHFDALFSDTLSAAALRRVEAPMLFMSGMNTNASTARIASMLRSALPAARHEVLEGMDHMGPVSKSTAVNRLLVDFLADVDAKAGLGASYLTGGIERRLTTLATA
jgi:pimeloyl-ACP methyl ester carboxylesterase